MVCKLYLNKTIFKNTTDKPYIYLCTICIYALIHEKSKIFFCSPPLGTSFRSLADNIASVGNACAKVTKMFQEKNPAT